MKLEDIGFYTLTNERAKQSSTSSPLWRNELIITSRCNFSCPYCRGTDINGYKGDMKFDEIVRVIDFWASQKIKNVRLSGGEPTIHPDILRIVAYIKSTCTTIEHIAISTNGYSDIELYKKLIEAGVNDFSISLDACCASIGDMMSGGAKGSWSRVVENIRALSKLTYVTVGMVFTPENAVGIRDSILFAHDLGVADIRVITAAQWDCFDVFRSLKLPQDKLSQHPILAYRLHNFAHGRNVRGIEATDSHRCGLILDDMIVKGDFHYPCVIKMREGCSPIGKVTDPSVRQDRFRYYLTHDCYQDEICRKNCLDVCVDYNNQFERSKIIQQTIVPCIDSTRFTKERWSAGSIHDFGIEHFRYDNVKQYRERLLEGLEGFCFGETLPYRPKENHVGLLYRTGTGHLWFHIRNNEFIQLIA